MVNTGTCLSIFKHAFGPTASRNQSGEDEQAWKPNCAEADESKRGKERRRWSFGRLAHNDTDNRRPMPTQKATSMDIATKAEQRQNQHALAIAAATAVAAEAAVAAAHAAAEVVRLAGDMQAGRPSSYYRSCSKDWAAVRIQAAFRGYLARKTLRSLRGLARLRALVRSPTVRRQATVTLRCMQALVRVQARVRGRHLRMLEEEHARQRQILQHRQQQGMSGEKDIEWNDCLRSMEEVKAKELLRQEAALKRERALTYAFAHQLWKPAPGGSNFKLYTGNEKRTDQLFWGWSWLERWMAARPSDAHLFEKEARPKTNSMEDTLSVNSVGANIMRNPSASDKMTNAAINNSSAHNLKVATKRRSSSPREPISVGTKMMSKNGATFSPNSSLTTPNQRLIHVKVTPASPWGAASRVSVEEGDGGMSTARSACSMYSVVGTKHFLYRRKSSLAGSSVRDDDSLISSPALPNYMVTTQSALAKARLASSPRQRRQGETTGREQHSRGVYARKRLSFPSVNAAATSVKNESGVGSTAFVSNKEPLQTHLSTEICADSVHYINHTANIETLAL